MQHQVSYPGKTQQLKDEDTKLVEDYNRLFKVVFADTPALKEETYKLRYQVYCQETAFENKDDFEDGLEKDIYDDQSLSSLLVHRESGKVAGTVRLILPDADKEILPAFQLSEDLNSLSDDFLPRATTAEISRFAISKDFRRRAYDTHMAGLEANDGGPGMSAHRIIPHITLGLMTAIVRMSLMQKLTHMTVVIEPTLQRLIKKLGMEFIPVGKSIEYHGRRRTLYNEIGVFLDRIYEERPELWAVITDCGQLWTYKNNNLN